MNPLGYQNLKNLTKREVANSKTPLSYAVIPCLPRISKSVGIPELKAGPIPDGFAGVLVLCFNSLCRCSCQMSVT